MSNSPSLSLPPLLRNKEELISYLQIKKDTRILDVGFFGQAVKESDPQWPHAILKKYSSEVYGVDLDFDEKKFPASHYLRASAEDFSFPILFDIVFAGDLIEHLSNPGLFLTCAMRHLAPGGKLVITTPNAFNLFSIVEKITHVEPNVNPDHTVYFNTRVLSVLFKKNNIESFSFSHLYTLGTLWQGGLKRKILASIYAALAHITPKFTEDMVAIAYKID